MLGLRAYARLYVKDNSTLFYHHVDGKAIKAGQKEGGRSRHEFLLGYLVLIRGCPTKVHSATERPTNKANTARETNQQAWYSQRDQSDPPVTQHHAGGPRHGSDGSSDASNYLCTCCLASLLVVGSSLGREKNCVALPLTLPALNLVTKREDPRYTRVLC